MFNYGFLRWTAVNGIAFLAIGSVMATEGSSQDIPSQAPSVEREARDQPRSMRDYIARQRSEKARKDHEELLKRGDEAVEIAEELEAAIARNEQLTIRDIEKLVALEKLVTRIRKGLGGEGDGEGLPDEELPEREDAPSVKSSVANLKELTVRLVDEMRKTSRFTISVVAVQSSNSVLSIVKFLRLRK